MAHRILIVDDEPNIVISLEYLLKKEGFEVKVALTATAPCSRPRSSARISCCSTS